MRVTDTIDLRQFTSVEVTYEGSGHPDEEHVIVGLRFEGPNGANLTIGPVEKEQAPFWE